MPRDGKLLEARGASGRRRPVVGEALLTLHDHLSGGAVRFADVLEALRTIEYGSIAGRGPCRMFRSVICRPNLDDRGVIAMECLQQMERVILRLARPSGAHLPRNGSSPDGHDRERAWGAA